MADSPDETTQAQKIAEAAARDYYQYGPDVRVTDTDGPTEIFGIRDGNRASSRAWVVSVEVPGKATHKLTVFRTSEGWYCVQTEPPVWKKD